MSAVAPVPRVAGSGEVHVIALPATFDIGAALAAAEEAAQLPRSVPVALDFGQVRVCHAFVLSVMLSKLAALGRGQPIRLRHLNRHQRRLLSYLRLEERVIVE